MAKNIDFMGATFPDVPSIRLPQHEGGLVSFTDVTDTTAVASDVANGKYFYTADGEKTVGTASGGITPSGTMSITSNGIYDIVSFASVDVNVSGGGGDHDAEDAIIARNISGVYENSRVTSIGENALNTCASLTTASFPNVTSIGNSAFAYCARLTTASFPNATSIGNSAFYYCARLTTVSLDNVTFIGTQCFKSCRKLESVYILASSVPTMSGSAVFASTPMSLSSYLGHFGSIYVPASLVDSYKSATNWSAYSERITSYVE